MLELQFRVDQWVERCFGPGAIKDQPTRALRLVEEACEFAQAVGVDRAKLDAVLDIVYSRPPGDPEQELGGVAVTAMAAAQSIPIYLEVAAKREVERIESKPVELFRARNAEKVQA